MIRKLWPVLIGATVGALAWWVCGFLVGLSNDYVLYKRFAPIQGAVLLVSCSFGALLGLGWSIARDYETQRRG